MTGRDTDSEVLSGGRGGYALPRPDTLYLQRSLTYRENGQKEEGKEWDRDSHKMGEDFPDPFQVL